MLNYEISKNGKEPLILLHGFMENNTIWEDMEESLSDQFQLIKIDLPGHGKSEVLGEIHTMNLMAEEVKKVIDHLQFSKVHLLGHSMGGYTALAFAELYPENLKSLSLFFSSTLEDNDDKKDIRRRSIEIINRNYPSFVDNSIANLFSENERDILRDKIELAKKIAVETNTEGVKASQLGMAERPNRTKILLEFNLPILIIAGKHDNAVKTETFFEHIPNRKNIKTYILDCGHNGHWEKPIICSSIINTELL